MSDLGDLLRRARAHKGVTLRDAEKRTRISRTYLAALEAHDFDQLPPRAYARGIVRNYAQYLGLDPNAVLAMYESAGTGGSVEFDDVEVVPAVQPIEIHGHWAPNFAIIIFMLVISAVVFTWIYSAYLQPDDQSVPTSIAQPTATPVELSLFDTIAPTATATESDATQDASSTDATPTEFESAQTPADDETDDDAPALDSTATQEADDPGTRPPGIEVLPEGIQVPEGYHVFSVYAEDEVWVQVTLDGDSIALDSVLTPGAIEIFLARTATITSGNAAYVRVYVDGEDQGTLGEPWDAVVTYP